MRIVFYFIGGKDLKKNKNQIKTDLIQNETLRDNICIDFVESYH